MHEIQESRKQFREGNPGFESPLWKKLGQEAMEAVQAEIVYFINPTVANRKHLGEELADMMFIICDMATKSQVDLHEAMTEKLAKDNKRFPPGTVMQKGDYMRRKIQLGERKR